MIEPSGETRRLVWDNLIDSDRMCRYYGYLAHRLKRLNDLLQVSGIVLVVLTISSFLYRLPGWIVFSAVNLAALSFALSSIRGYSAKALRSNEIFRQLGRLNVEWELLWNNVSTKDDDTVLESWKKLSERQLALIERAPFDLPLSASLARKSQQEAYEYWSEFARTHQSSSTAVVPGESRSAAASIAHH
ncbi:MAG: hypothetical protein OXH92_21240 [Bryobacterales bacterium]|nr:hypothetical protein [Bryobacterales bacterium]MDE0296078.1 hypothetical protein [Bryobacterales bacterium]MDE0436530.1 hypothetical protein [Bryobacterales bacterium]